jgi:TonB family protein
MKYHPYLMIGILAFLGCSATAPTLNAKQSASSPALENASPAPKPVSVVRPVYPFEAARAEISGTVTVVFTIDPAGIVHDIQIAECTSAEFRDPTVRALSRWRFPKQAGGPYKLTFSFVSTGSMGGKVNWQ